MAGQEKARQASLLVSLFLALVVGFLTYNSVSVLFHYKDLTSDKRFPASLDSSDPPVIVKEDTGRASARYHVAMTASDSTYNKWQSRIMYYYYLKVKDAPLSDMGGFTRILHSGRPDDLMDEIPTFIVDPLPRGMDMGYVVLHRPWAFVQWLNLTTIEEEYVLMAEPDHIFMYPLPNLAQGDYPAGYPFFYIRILENEKIIRKYFPEENGPVTNIDPIGNSPAIIKKGMLKEIAPTWMNMSIAMKKDKEADKAFGWVLEMYAYAVAAALHNVSHILRKDFMVQPPFDEQLDKKFILHYTYGCGYTNGKVAAQFQGDWQWNKRYYSRHPPPKNIPRPPPEVADTVVLLLERINEGTANIPGWDGEEGEDK